jgi:dTDP-4-dehydrorhamnose 3,5-epimerase
MDFIRTGIPDVIICEPTIHGDSRGYFLETFKKEAFEDFIGFEVPFCQDNESKSGYGVLRGLHYQLPPFAQSKLVRVIKGSVLDVAVDIRKGSPTFGKHVAIELNGENKRQIFVPRGFAHGFIVLSEEAIFAYKVDNYYSKEHDRGLSYHDPTLNIDWKLNKDDFKLSAKDTCQPMLGVANLFDYKINLYE